MCRKVFSLLRFICISFLFTVSIVSAQSSSIFLDELCNLPCWMNLVPGESTSEDVLRFIADESIDDLETLGVLDETNGSLTKGIYRFSLATNASIDLFVAIEIYDALIFSIVVDIGQYQATEYIFMEDAIRDLGQPDIVHTYPSGAQFGDEPYITFVYLEARLRIKFNSPFLSSPCLLSSIGSNMAIYSLTYYSPEAAQVVSKYPGHDESQSALTALHLGERNVSQVIWQEVMNGQHEELCRLIPSEYSNLSTAPIIYEEPLEPLSFFLEDSCLPPCWFGLVAGEGRSEDVTGFVENSNSLFQDWKVHPDSRFDEEAGLMVSGTYFSNWLFHEYYGTGTPLVDVSLSLADRVLERISVSPNHAVLFFEVLQSLGTPDYIFIDSEDTTGAGLKLVYLTLNLEIYFRSVLSDCVVERMSNNFWIDRVVYHSPDSMLQAQRNFGTGMTEVPDEIWVQWINGGITGSCQAVWSNLIDN